MNKTKNITLNTEENLQKSVIEYLRYQYPDVLFHANYLSEYDIMIFRAVKQKRGDIKYGLFIELKRENEKLFLKDDFTYKNEHIINQSMIIEKLNREGYSAWFCMGFDATKTVIDLYLKGEEK